MSAPSTIGAILAHAAAALDAVGVEDPRLEAQLLLAHAAGVSRASVLAHPEQPLDPPALSAFRQLLRARAAERVPLAYLTGWREFYGRRFQVNSHVLIPRPESELLVDHALAALAAYPPAARPRVLDLGTGSGSLAVSIALGAPRARVFASDVSHAALLVARANAERLGADVRFFQADLLGSLRGTLDVLVANLPYVSWAELEGTQPEVRAHEPALALVGGTLGTEVIERLLPQLPAALGPHGVALLEIGWLQGNVLRLVARRLLPDSHAEVLPDQAGLGRILRLTHA